MTLIRIENECNQNCVFCSFVPSRERQKIDLDAVFRQIEGSKEKLVQFSGGEPFLAGCKALLRAVVFAVKKRKTVEIQTNAALIPRCDRKTVLRMIEIMNASGGYFNVNLAASGAALDKLITGTANFREKIKAVKFLLDSKAVVRITHIIFRANYRRLPGFARFVAEELPRIGWVQFSFVKAMGRAMTKKIVPPYSAVSPFLIKACNILEKSGIKFEIDHIPSCMAGRHWKSHVDIGKRIEKKDGPQVREKTFIARCRGCEFANICYGPRKDYLKLYENL